MIEEAFVEQTFSFHADISLIQDSDVVGDGDLKSKGDNPDVATPKVQPKYVRTLNPSSLK